MGKISAAGPEFPATRERPPIKSRDFAWKMDCSYRAPTRRKTTSGTRARRLGTLPFGLSIKFQIGRRTPAYLYAFLLSLSRRTTQSTAALKCRLTNRATIGIALECFIQ